MLLIAALLQLGLMVLDVEIADTLSLQLKGLSGRTELPDGTGMLFVYQKPQLCGFWMKDTLVPLSVGFFDADQTLIHWLDMPKTNSKTTYKSQKPAQYALEVPLGWFEKHEIEPGMKFHLKNSSKTVD